MNKIIKISLLGLFFVGLSIGVYTLLVHQSTIFYQEPESEMPIAHEIEEIPTELICNDIGECIEGPDKMQEKIQKMLERPCEEMRVIPEWEEPNEYTHAYDQRHKECMKILVHEDTQLIKIYGERHIIDITLNNADVDDIEYHYDSNVLKLTLDTLDDGEIFMKIPRDLYHYPHEDRKQIALTLQNGIEIDFVDTSDELHYILEINFIHPNPTIEIVGSFYP